MPTEPQATEPAFGGEPSRRLLWVLPSVLLHLVAFMVWYSLPEEAPRELDERKLIVRSEQAEQLQQHVEDANLRELHYEVQRLQEIKQSMASLRAEGMAALAGFEAEMRSTVETDVGEVLAELLELQQALARGQADVLQEISALADVFETMQPLIEQNAASDLVPHAGKALALRNVLQAKQTALDQQLLSLHAKLDTADNVVGWIEEPELGREWAGLVVLQERAFGLQSSSSDEQGRIQAKQIDALRWIMDEGAAYSSRVQQTTDAEDRAQEDYDRNKALFAERGRKAAAEQKDLESKLKALRLEMQKVRETRKQLSGNRGRINHKTPDAQEKRARILGEMEEQDRLYSRLAEDKKAADMALHAVKQESSKARVELRKLRPPSAKAKNERQRLVERMGRSIQALEDRVGNLSTLREAYQLQEEACQKSQALITRATQSLEGAL